MRALVLTLIGVVLSAFAHCASGSEVWFAPNDDLGRGAGRDVFLNRDFSHLFDDSPAWSAKTDVFQITAFMASLFGPETELRRVDAFLKARHIRLAVAIDATVSDNPRPLGDTCGVGVEGARRPGENTVIFRRLKKLGLEIAYVAMDEPLTFGHYFRGKAGCRYDIADTARRAASAVAEVKAFYPDVRIVDYEAPPAMPTARWHEDFQIWLKAYRQAAGAPLDAVVFDVDPFSDWRDRVRAGAAIAKQEGTRIGIFLVKPGEGHSDAEAVADYKRAATIIEASKIRFDIVEISNWTIHPFDNLPETEPTTLTHVLDWYNRRHGRR